MPACPDDDTLSAFAERRLTGTAQEAIEEHLDGCAECLAVVAEIANGAGAEAEAPPSEAPPSGGSLERMLGSVVGRYTLVEMIGEGGMGAVFLAHDPQLDRRVALKVLRAGRAAQPEVRERMAREARTMARLKHPNIVTVHDAGEVDGRFHIAMELVEGTTLGGWLKETPRSTEDILATFETAGRALVAAHAAGVVHRDFKPDNVLIDRAGRVVVTDFGIAVSHHEVELALGAAPAGADARSGLTRTGTVLGTPRYMSPEQHEGERVDARADQWSFAVALYEALYDVAPFGGADLAALRRSVAERRFADPPAPPRRKVPPRVRAALLRALALRPEDRFPDLGAMLSELHPPRWWQRSRGLAIAAASALVLAVVGWRALPTRPAASLPIPATPTALAVAPDADGRRAILILAPFANRTDEARLDGVMEAALRMAVSASRRVDTLGEAQLPSIVQGLDVAPEVRGLAAARELAARERVRVFMVTGAVEKDGAGVRATVTATRVDSGAVLFEDHASAAGVADLGSVASTLAAKLRAALGDPPPAGEAPPHLSASLEALHDWVVGRRLLDEGDYVKAQHTLEGAVAADPRFAEAHADLSLALYNVQDSPAAAKELKLALEHGEGMSQRRKLGLLADAYAAEGRAAESIATAEQLLAIWPGDLQTQSAVTATAIDACYWPLALELARRAVADHPRGIVPRSNLVLALLGNNEIDEAARTGDRDLAELSRLRRFGYAFDGVAHGLRGEPDRALAAYDELAALDAEFADEARADLAIYEGHLDEAARLLQGQIDAALARREPESARTEYRSLALVRLRRGDRAGALASGRAALGGGSVVLRYQVASVLLEAGDEKPAAAMIHDVSDPSSVALRAHAKLLEGDVLRHHGKLREARAAYEAAGHVQDLWRVHLRLGETALSEQRWADAERELAIAFARAGEVAVTETPSLQLLPPVVEGLARARAALGDGGAGRSK